MPPRSVLRRVIALATVEHPVIVHEQRLARREREARRVARCALDGRVNRDEHRLRRIVPSARGRPQRLIGLKLFDDGAWPTIRMLLDTLLVSACLELDAATTACRRRDDGRVAQTPRARW